MLTSLQIVEKMTPVMKLAEEFGLKNEMTWRDSWNYVHIRLEVDFKLVSFFCKPIDIMIDGEITEVIFIESGGRGAIFGDEHFQYEEHQQCLNRMYMLDKSWLNPDKKRIPE